MNFWKGAAFCIAAALAWALIGPLSRVCFAAGMGPADVSFWRIALSGACFLLHARLAGELHARPREFASVILFGVLNVPLLMLALQISIQKSGGAVAIILMFTAPAWVALFSRILFHERLTPAKLSAMVVAMAGTGLVCLSGGSMGGEVSWTGLACGLLSGFVYAMQFPFVVLWKGRFSTAALFGVMFTPAAAVLAPFAEFMVPGVPAVAALAVLGLLSTYVAYFLYGMSLRFLTPVQAAVIGNLEPVAGTILSWWFWNENFSAAGWLGCAFVIASVLILATKK